MKSEIIIVQSIKDGAGLFLSATSLAKSKIKELEASTLTNKTALINAIDSALTTIQTQDANNQIDYSNPNAAEIVTFNNAIGAASTALEGDKKTKIANLQTSHATLSGKVTEAEGKISGLEIFKQTQEAANTGVQASLSGLNSELAVIKKKALDNTKEYFQGNYIPTKASEPASLWNTLDKCLEHEGDIYTIKVDAQSPQSAHDKNMFQYMFYRTTKGDPTSVADFDWMEMGSGQYSALSASVATLDQKVMDHDSDAHFKEKITANKDKIVSEVKKPIADQAKQDIVSDNAFVNSVTPKIDGATGKWKNADGTVSENYAVADKVPAFTSAVSGANTAASNANAAKDAAQEAATNANSKAAAAQSAASAANEKAALANTAAGAANAAKTAADNAAAAANAAKTAANTAASNANSKADAANIAASSATAAASGANQAKNEILQAKNNGEFSAVRLYADRVGEFRNGKVVGGIGGKVILTPKWFAGGVEKPVPGSGKTVKWYKQNPGGSDILKKTVTANGSTDVRLLLGDGEMGTYYFDLNV